jgi:hypothetical protein
MPKGTFGSQSDQLRCLLTAAAVALAGCLAWSTAQATPIPLGYISWDVTNPGNFGEFDIVNQTGPNSSLPDWPVSTEVQFKTLSLTVNFSDGSTQVFGPSYFTLNVDGESLDGMSIAIGGMSPQPVMATLTGDLTPTTITVNGTSTTVDPSFDTATITDSPILVDGDFAIINAETGVVPPPVPEPNMTLTFLVGCFMAVIFTRRRGWRRASRTIASLAGLVGSVLAFAGILFPTGSFAATSLFQNVAANPGSGVARVSFVNITATDFPPFIINPANVTIRLAPTCTVGATLPVAGEADATATSVKKILGSTDRISFEVPSTLLSGAPITKGTYLAQIVDTTDGFSGGNCSIVNVTKTNPVLTCVPSSSMAVVAGATVTAYVPKSCWSACSATTGVSAVEIEPTLGGSSTPIATASPVNACAGNPATGQVVCTANNTSVYLISGTTLTNTLTSGLTGTASFSGGSCQNCGVAINALSNTAAIAGGLSGSPSGDGVQILNLSSNTFQPPFSMQQRVSEDISIDAGRNLILSPSELNNYALLSTNSATGAVTGEFDRPISTGGDPDSAAEDCSTGIALSSVEGTNNVYLADLNQSTLTPGNPAGSWTSPFTLFTITGESLGFSAGTSGITVASGSSHLAIVTGEFGGNTFAILQLQPSSGTGGAAPTVVDWVVGAMPNSPDGAGFSAGFDPHTITAYTSPNSGKAIGLYSDWAPGTPKYVGVIDMAAALAATRAASPNNYQIASSVNLITSGIVSYVAVP